MTGAQRAVVTGVLEAGRERHALPLALHVPGDHERRVEGPRGVARTADPGLQHVARRLDRQGRLVRLELGEARRELVDEADGGRAVFRAAGGGLERKHRDALLGGQGIEPDGPTRAVEERGAGPEAEPDEPGEGGHEPAPAQAQGALGARHLVRARRHRSARLGEVLAELAQVAREVERRGVSLGRLLGEAAALDEPPHGRGHVRVEARDRLGRVLDDRGDGLRRRLPAERLAVRSRSRRGSRRA